MSQSTPSPRKSSAWSVQFADRYRCELSDSLADWLDSEIWKYGGLGEYREPIHPESLLCDAPEDVWPGLMTGDVLPLIGNNAGDWLCVRIGPDNQASEIIQWYHGGGDWIPWGRNLAEAVVLDAIIDRLPGPSRRHAVPAEDPRPAEPSVNLREDPLLRWALPLLPPPVADVVDESLSEQQVAQTLLDAEVAEIAIRCELVVAELMHPAREAIRSIRQSDGKISAEQLAEWSFDLDRIPADKRSWLEQQLGTPLGHSQNWSAAADHARRVTEIAPELAWAWDIVAYVDEREDDMSGAIEAYRRAAECSVFTDQSIRLETHWASDLSAKFSVARLQALCPEAIGKSEYYKVLCGPDVRQRRMNATDYWRHEANQAVSAGDYRKAHDCFFAAAWDVGADSITIYAELLDRIAEAAERSNQPGRAATAQTHRRCLADRYGL